MIIEARVMIFAFPVKWLVMFLKFNVMFFLHRIMFTSLRVFHLGCGAIFVIYEKAYTKMAPQGAIPNHLSQLIQLKGWSLRCQVFLLAKPIHKINWLLNYD